MLADCLLSGIAKHVLCCKVPTGDDSVQCFADNSIVGGFNNGSQPELIYFGRSDDGTVLLLIFSLSLLAPGNIPINFKNGDGLLVGISGRFHVWGTVHGGSWVQGGGSIHGGGTV